MDVSGALGRGASDAGWTGSAKVDVDVDVDMAAMIDAELYICPVSLSKFSRCFCSKAASATAAQMTTGAGLHAAPVV
jgi:hypothetical protein